MYLKDTIWWDVLIVLRIKAQRQRPRVNWAWMSSVVVSWAGRRLRTPRGNNGVGESSWVWEKQLTYQLVSGERLQIPPLQSAVFVTEHQLNSPLCDPPDLHDPSSPNKHQIKPPSLQPARCLKRFRVYLWNPPTLLAGFTTLEFRWISWLHIDSISKEQGAVQRQEEERMCK